LILQISPGHAGQGQKSKEKKSKLPCHWVGPIFVEQVGFGIDWKDDKKGGGRFDTEREGVFLGCKTGKNGFGDWGCVATGE